MPTVNWKKIEIEGLPIKSGEYLIYKAENDSMLVSYYNANNKEFKYSGSLPEKFVSHWSELPETPND
jgi:hypothetical protein